MKNLNRNKVPAVLVAFGVAAMLGSVGAALAGSPGNPNDGYRPAAQSARALTAPLRQDGDRIALAEHQNLVMQTIDANAHAMPGMDHLSLDGHETSRLLSAAGVHGRVVVEPVNDGAGLCVARTPRGQMTSQTSCWKRYPDSGVLATWAYGDSVRVSGIAADDVESVVIHLASGERAQVPIGRNLFTWESENRGESVVKLESVRDGVSHFTSIGDPRK